MTTETTTLADQIRARLDDWDAEHDTANRDGYGCPGGPECIHTAVAGLRAVLDLAERQGGKTLVLPFEIPEAVARALGIINNPSDPITQDRSA